MESTTPWRGRLRCPRQGVVDGIEMSDVAADVAAVAAFLAADTTDVLAADTTDVFSAAKAVDGGPWTTSRTSWKLWTVGIGLSGPGPQLRRPSASLRDFGLGA